MSIKQEENPFLVNVYAIFMGLDEDIFSKTETIILSEFQ